MTTSSKTPAYLLLVGSCLIGNVHAGEASGCSLNLSESELDYGQISPAQLKYDRNDRFINLPPRTFTLTAHCQQPTAMRIAFNGIGTPNRAFLLGHVGEFTLDITRASLDGQTVPMRSNQGEETRLFTGEALVPYHANRIAFGKRLELQLRATPRIDTHNTRASDELRIHGEGHFQLDTP